MLCSKALKLSNEAIKKIFTPLILVVGFQLPVDLNSHVMIQLEFALKYSHNTSEINMRVSKLFPLKLILSLNDF